MYPLVSILPGGCVFGSISPFSPDCELFDASQGSGLRLKPFPQAPCAGAAHDTGGDDDERFRP